ncbi:hypothetical protein BUALT_Bualt11G0105900 [Buddleja alternifolia]|uniref:Uncharacterized protein n=1 Tax=Buddleja alternifolia TaxID=168488 RepID=A0AAV6WUV5_9LAMI|nr:hypothetical protein BUALT_Bualt11G0105900 [Buddleja alternifolia]
MTIQEQNIHFIMLPFMAQGHSIPMVDLSRLLAKRGLKITILTTPHNYSRFEPIFLRAKDSGLDINIFLLKFPYAEAGLPEGCENFDMLPSINDAMSFFTATAMLKDQVLEFLQETGLRVGVEEAVMLGEEENVGVLVKNDEIKRAVESLMDGGEEGEERRKRARELGEKAMRTVEEGGSSYLNMTLLIQDVVTKRDSYGELSANDVALVQDII